MKQTSQQHSTPSLNILCDSLLFCSVEFSFRSTSMIGIYYHIQKTFSLSNRFICIEMRSSQVLFIFDIVWYYITHLWIHTYIHTYSIYTIKHLLYTVNYHVTKSNSKHHQSVSSSKSFISYTTTVYVLNGCRSLSLALLLYLSFFFALLTFVFWSAIHST